MTCPDTQQEELTIDGNWLLTLLPRVKQEQTLHWLPCAVDETETVWKHWDRNTVNQSPSSSLLFFFLPADPQPPVPTALSDHLKHFCSLHPNTPSRARSAQLKQTEISHSAFRREFATYCSKSELMFHNKQTNKTKSLEFQKTYWCYYYF